MPNQKQFIRFSGYLLFFHVIQLENYKNLANFLSSKKSKQDLSGTVY